MARSSLSRSAAAALRRAATQSSASGQTARQASERLVGERHGPTFTPDLLDAEKLTAEELVVASASDREYRIDDLAREGGTTVRNVRVYQDRGLLPPPRKQGRTGWYSEAHLARLRLITRLLERGYTFATIGELLTASEHNLRVDDLLGLDDVLSRPWSDEPPATLSALQLARMFGKQSTPATLARACELGLMTRVGTQFEVSSPRLVAAAKDLVAAGFPLLDVIEVAAGVQTDLDRVAERFVSVMTEHLLPDGPPTDGVTTEQVLAAAGLIDQLRPHASKAVHALFARAMEKEIARAFERLTKYLMPEHPEDRSAEG